MEPIVVLGQWHMPEELASIKNTVWGPIGPFAFHRSGNWEHRGPATGASIAGADVGAIEWHQDNYGRRKMLVVWSNIFPTEILLPNDKIVTSKPNDVVLLANHIVRHRVPAAYRNKVLSGQVPDRHFFRLNQYAYPSPEEIEEWKMELAKKKR